MCFLLAVLCFSLQCRQTVVTLSASAFVLFFCCSCYADGSGHGFNLPRRERACFHACAERPLLPLLFVIWSFFVSECLKSVHTIDPYSAGTGHGGPGAGSYVFEALPHCCPRVQFTPTWVMEPLPQPPQQVTCSCPASAVLTVRGGAPLQF